MYIKLLKENLLQTNSGIFQGWGSSLCWWANRIGYSEELTKSTAELFYGEKGLALNIMRYNIGGGDDPAHHHITRTDSAMPGWTKWNSETESFQWAPEQDMRQLNVLKKCYEEAQKHAREYTYVEAFSNSAPYYMTKSGCSSGGANPEENNLKEECYEAFAEYLAKVCDWIQKNEKITICSIAAMNEPNTSYWSCFSPKQEGCHFDPGFSQSKILLETKRAFLKYGLENVEITASDETGTDRQLQSCKMYSDEAWKIINRISTHTYETGQRKELGKYIAGKNINLWMSEADGSFTVCKEAGEMSAALGLAQKIIDDMNELKPSAWVLWQMIDSHISKDIFCGNRDFGMPDLSGGYWGVAVADHDANEIILTKKYYAFGQFSKFIRPGSRLLFCGEHALASWDSVKKEICLVTVNLETEEQEIIADLSDFGILKNQVMRIRTSGTSKDENWCQENMICETVTNQFYDIIPSFSIATYIFHFNS